MTVDNQAGDCYRARANVRNIIEVMIRYGFAIYLRSSDEEKVGIREDGKYIYARIA